MKKQTDIKILVVDDELESMEVVTEMIACELECTVLTAADGKEALDLAQKELLHLILMDVNMPRMDGFTACRKLKEDNSLKDIPVLFITNQSDEEAILEGFSAGGIDYISKPFLLPVLVARVNAHLNHYLSKLELKEALDNVKQLEDLLKVCSYCKCMKEDNGEWVRFEEYIMTHTNAAMTHGICPECYEKEMKRLEKK